MKYFFTILLFTGCLSASAQNNQVSSLPQGRYETVLEPNQTKWEKGDIILIDQNSYRLSSSNEVGEYKFSVAAQRIFFTSGPMRNYFAKTTSSSKGPTILLPVSENQRPDSKLPANVTAYFKP